MKLYENSPRSARAEGLLGVICLLGCLAERPEIYLGFGGAASIVATVAAVTAALFCLVGFIPQEGCAGTHVGSDGQCQDGNNKSQGRDGPHPAACGDRHDSAEEQRDTSEHPEWAGDCMSIVPSFLSLADFYQAEAHDTITGELTRGGEAAHDEEYGGEGKEDDGYREHVP